MDDPIGVDHRKNLENEVVPQRLRDFLVGCEKDDEVVHDPT